MARGRPKGSKNKSELQKKEINEEVNEMIKENQEIKLTKEQQIRKDKLNQTLREINLKYKDPLMCKYAKDEPAKESLPFRIKEINDFLGGGAVYGNFIIIWGSESVGKTSLCFEQIIQAQLENKNVIYIDMEHTLDKERAKKIGVDLDKLVIIENAETAEQAMDITIKFAKDKCVDLLIIDSIQAMSPKGEQFKGKANTEKSMEDNNVALLARKMSEFLRRTASAVYKGKMAVILVGQARTGGIGSFATHEELTGGRAEKFYSLLTVHMRKGQGADAPTISEKKEVIELNDEGEKVKKIKTIQKKIGFNVVLTINKTKKSNSQTEMSELRLPYYYKSGFIKE